MAGEKKEEYNAFDVRLAYQFLKYKDDLEKDEEMRECYRHTNRVLNSAYSSDTAKTLMKYLIDQMKKNPQDLENYKKNLCTVCKRIVAKSKSQIHNMFDDNLSEEILSYSDG